MPLSPVKPVLSLLALAAACDGTPTDFSPPRRLAAEDRPIVWDRPTRERLRVAEMAAPKAEVRWAATTPAGWETRPPEPARFRDLQWQVQGDPSTDCYFTAGVGGGPVGNIERWYRQFGLPPQTGDDLPTVSFAGETGRLLELAGTYNDKPGQRMLLAFTSHGQTVTSLKFVGPDAVVASHRDAFLGLAASIHREGGGAPADDGAAGAAAVTDPFAATVPADWRPQTGSSKSLHHSFGADGEVYVSQLSGDVRAMLDIWRGEMGQKQPLTDAEFAALPRCELLGPDAWWLDLSGDFAGMGKSLAGARVVVAVQKDGGGITFAKLVGPAGEVAAQLEAFRTFCATLRRNQ